MMNDEFGLLVACDGPRWVNGLLPRAVHGSRSLNAGSLDGLTILIRDDMLILAYHVESSKVELSKAQLLDWVVNGRPL